MFVDKLGNLARRHYLVHLALYINTSSPVKLQINANAYNVGNFGLPKM